MGLFAKAAQKIEDWWYGTEGVQPASIRHPPIAVLKSMLGSYGADNRAIISTMGIIGGPEATAALMEKFDKCCMEHGHIAETLGRIKHESSIRALVKLMSHWDEHVKDDAIGALAKKGESAVPALMEIFRNGDEHEKWNAAWILNAFENEEVLDYFKERTLNGKDVYSAASRLASRKREDVIPYLIIASAREKDWLGRDNIRSWMKDVAYGKRIDLCGVRSKLLELLDKAPAEREAREIAIGYKALVRATGKYREKFGMPKLPAKARPPKSGVFRQPLRRRAVV